jgi:hypothetical protein
MPSAAEIAVDACPVSKASYELSPILGNPEIPPNVLRV